MTHTPAPALRSRREIATAWRIAVLTLVAAASLSIAGCGADAEAQGGPPKGPAVSVSPVVQRRVFDSEEFSGRLEAPDYVELRARVSGTIDEVHFVDGALVHKGDVLFTIDPRPFEAEVARQTAVLASTKARAELATSELARSKTLLAEQASSKQEFDEFTATARTSQADYAAAQAALQVAKLNLEYTEVRAPITGRASRANITLGNLVNSESLLTSITSVSRTYAYFDASEQSYLRLRAQTAGGAVPKVRLGLANETGFPHEGQLDFVDNRLNPQTGAIRLRASFDNSKGLYTPGLAAHVSLESPQQYDAVMVPERAIGTDQSKKYVYVVADDGKPQFREIVPGALFDGMRVVKNGSVKPGENVIVEGLLRVVPGITVTPQVLKVDAKGLPIFPPPAGAKS